MRIITIDSNQKVIGVKNVGDSYLDNPGLQTGEIVSEIGEHGQIMQPDGSFIDDATPPPVPEETAEEKLVRLEQQIRDNNLIQFEVLATIFEEILDLKDQLGGA